MSIHPFKVISDHRPTGDQPAAIDALVKGFARGKNHQTLEGVTGSGKTFTMANVIQEVQKPALVVSHNKTLAAQLYAEFKRYLPENAVEFFISYYDYYQPEAYIPQTDTFIEKDSSINEEIERLRLAATNALLNRDDVVIVASVSCIYGLGSPEDYREMVLSVQTGDEVERDEMLKKLVDIQYTRNDFEHTQGTFRVRGDTVDVYESYVDNSSVRFEFFGDEIEKITRIDPLTGKNIESLDYITISPAKHFVMPKYKIDRALSSIREELEQQVNFFEKNNKLLEAQRIRMRTEFDLTMLKEMGFCQGVENYSRHLSGRGEGERPATLIDYFKGDFLTILDESHVTLPQINGMYNGDRSRKTTLVEHGFRLPSALDNRPLRYDEFAKVTNQTLYVSATPGPFEREQTGMPVLQVVRPTGIIDPPVDIRPLSMQIDDLMEEVKSRAERNERTLVSTLTKRTAEDLTEYLTSAGLNVRYMHSEIDAIQRVEILRGLRNADFDCLIGINLLREGLDLPEVSLVAILDADKEGFLRSETALVQTAGRAARHLDGQVILYADKVTDSMQAFLDRTEERRKRQLAYNRKHNITPTAIITRVHDSLSKAEEVEDPDAMVLRESGEDLDINQVVADMEKEMLEAAEQLQFERAAMLRDQIQELQAVYGGGSSAKTGSQKKSMSYRGKEKNPMSLKPENADKKLIQDTEELIERALAEDIGSGDVTCEAVIPADSRLSAAIRIREKGTVCGLWVVERVFKTVDPTVNCNIEVEEGQDCETGQVLMNIEGPARAVLTGERTALNLLQHLCGISSFTRRCAVELEGTKTILLDTRKTTPGMRRLEKYAVRCGGGHNHRMGLYDRIMVKDNHLALRGAVEGGALNFNDLVKQADMTHPGIDVEIEVDTVEQFKQALQAGPEWILLDNMSNEEMKACVELNRGTVQLEASGTVTPGRLKEIAACGVDAVSMGALTHSVPAIDIGLDYL